MLFNTYGIKNITAQDLQGKIRNNEDFLLLDVRTPQEHHAEAIENSYLLPVQELSFRTDELPQNKEIVVYCRVGNRSAFAAAYLARMGYQVKNLEGGIIAWNSAGNGAYARA
ncbi:MAG: rhodanese-like domain-containing protein [Nitrospirota bacterium]|nr:rhodanese-like domain-containing protein [Nitrospirota bacterium]